MIFIYGMTILLAACSLLYELLIAQALSSMVANSVIWYSVTIGFYLVSMGFGAMRSKELFSQENARSSLVTVELILSLLGSLSVIAIHLAHRLFSFLWYQPSSSSGIVASSLFFCSVFLAVVLIGFFSGIELPLLIQLSQEESTKKNANRILACDYFGSLLAGILFPLFLIPQFSLLAISFGVALSNLLAAFLLLGSRSREVTQKVRKIVAVMVLVGIVCVLFLNQESLEQVFLKNYYYSIYQQHLDAEEKGFLQPIERYRSRYSTIDIVTKPKDINPLTPDLLKIFQLKNLRGNNKADSYSLFINGDFQFNSDTEELYHEYFAHVPLMSFSENPEKILVLGAGDGLLIREILKYPWVREIVHVEIDPEMVRLAKESKKILSQNQRALWDPKVKTIIADAYQYVKTTTEKFDAIFIDFPAPNNYDLSKLYSAEFYSFVKTCLRPEAFIALDATWITSVESIQERDPSLRINSWANFFNTLKKSGYQTIIPYYVNLKTDKAIYKSRIKAAVEKRLKEKGDSAWSQAYHFMREQKGEEYVIEKILKTHAENLQQGFIIVKKEATLGGLTYQDKGLSLDSLNEERFYASFQFVDDLSRDVKEKKVNSIFRPTLPFHLTLGGIKTPY